MMTNNTGYNLEEKIIIHCAPTLAGLKTANMFRFRYGDSETLQEALQVINEKMYGKGVYVEVLKKETEHVLIYVYRSNKLKSDLALPAVVHLLKKYGYQSFQVDDCLTRLKERIAHSDEFPHEIGVFLSYPLEDVLGFIEQKGKNYKYSGLWKVYGNESETKKLFAKFVKCTNVYRKVFADGRNLTQLTVAA